MCACTHTHAHTHVHTHTCMHVQAHTHTKIAHARTHTHTHKRDLLEAGGYDNPDKRDERVLHKPDTVFYHSHHKIMQTDRQNRHEQILTLAQALQRLAANLPLTLVSNTFSVKKRLILRSALCLNRETNSGGSKRACKSSIYQQKQVWYTKWSYTE